MYYLVDGYNLIFSLMKGAKEDLALLRQKMIRALQKQFAAKNISGTLVFDGAHRREEESGLSYPSPLIVAYAPKGQTADEYIIEQIQWTKHPKEMVVITNDRGLAMHAKSAGAKVQRNDTFIRWLHKRKQSPKPRELKESPQNIERLRKIFEERLKNDEC